MSIANELHWTTAAKPKFGKATEHSGAKKGKGAWDKKKVAKKTSNKGRRAGGKQEIKDQTVGDESDGPFPGAAPLFKKAAAMHWTTAEPRPCYPTEDPVEDHCNDGIAPPAPGGGDDMGDSIFPPGPGGADDAEIPRDPASPESIDEHEDRLLLRHQRDSGNQLDTEEDLERKFNEENPPDAGGYEWDEWEEQDDLNDQHIREGIEPDPTGKAWRDMRGDDEFPGSAKDERGGGGRQRGPRELQMSGPHDARDPGLAPDAPHQFWAQEAPHVQDAMNKYLMPKLNSPDPKVAQKAQRILMEGPHADKRE